MSLDARDAALRASMLYFARDMGGKAIDGWVVSSKLAIAARDDAGRGVDSEDHAARLINDLIAWGLLGEKERQHVTAGTPAGEDLRFRRVKVTEMEWQRFLGRIDPIPGVADRRNQ